VTRCCRCCSSTTTRSPRLPTAKRGLRLFKASARFELVITDILMPGIDGARVIVEMRQLRPSLPIVAISGGRRVLSPQFNLETASLAGATCQLAKPFSRQGLQSAIRQALSGEGT
jgi:CheY-like chemotaxis protein